MAAGGVLHILHSAAPVVCMDGCWNKSRAQDDQPPMASDLGRADAVLCRWEAKTTALLSLSRAENTIILCI